MTRDLFPCRWSSVVYEHNYPRHSLDPRAAVLSQLRVRTVCLFSLFLFRPCLVSYNDGCQLRDSHSSSSRAHQVYPPLVANYSALFANTLKTSSLPQDEVPFKLRCAICSKLAVNAFKTPCCEQMICENCRESPLVSSLMTSLTDAGKLTLPSTCPVCEHTPVSAEDCKPNNKLRMTTRAFLKTAEKKRDTSAQKESTPITPITPIDPKPSATPATAPFEQPAQEAPADVPSVSISAVGATQENGQTDEAPVAGKEVVPAPADEATEQVPADGDEVGNAFQNKSSRRLILTYAQNAPSGEQVLGETENQDNQAVATKESNAESGDAEAAAEGTNEGGEDNTVDNQQKPSFPNAFGFGAMNGQFPNMNFGNGDFNQMQMMMAMQNGMAPNGFGFPMMGKSLALGCSVEPKCQANVFLGMSNMSMDPSMMNMYQMNNGFGAPGMDMSMMNGGMGGFNGGGGSEENWNGPQSWNNGQNNYNHPNASGMGNGDYGNFNSGYQTGYNQGNFGPHNQYNDFRGRGYGRGFNRGGRYRGNFINRGGYAYGQQHGNYYQGQNYMNQQHHHQQQQYGSNAADQGPSASQYGSNGSSGEGASDKNVDEYGRTIRPTTGQSDSQQEAERVEGSETKTENGEGEDKAQDKKETEPADGSEQKTSAIEVYQPGLDGEANGIQDPRMRPNGPPFGGHQRVGSFGGMPPPAVPAVDVPLNAPKGPKAMLQGLPNTSLLNLRARGYPIPTSDSNRMQSPGVQSGHGGFPTPGDDDRDYHRSRSNSIASTVKRRGDESEYRRDRDRSRSRSRTDKERDGSHRDRERRGRDDSEARSTSRSRSREHRDRKRKSRHSDSDDERGHDKERRRRHRSSKKHYDDDEPRSSREDKYGDRSRSASPASRKSSHRSSRKERDSEKRRERDRDRERERDRDKDSEDDRDYKRKSSHRSSHRDRDHDRSDRSDRDRDRDGKDRDRKRDRDRERDRDRDRDRDREKRRSKHSTAEPPTPTEASSEREVKEFNPPTGPRGSISKNYSIFSAPKPFETIKGASSKSSMSINVPKGPSADRGRRSSQAPSVSRSGAPAGAATATPKDPHAAEREARNRERLLKETQRLAGLGGGLKRRSEEGLDSGSRSSKRKRRGGEPREDAGEEARMKKLEAEREGSRWT